MRESIPARIIEVVKLRQKFDAARRGEKSARGTHARCLYRANPVFMQRSVERRKLYTSKKKGRKDRDDVGTLSANQQKGHDDKCL